MRFSSTTNRTNHTNDITEVFLLVVFDLFVVNSYPSFTGFFLGSWLAVRSNPWRPVLIRGWLFKTFFSHGCDTDETRIGN